MAPNAALMRRTYSCTSSAAFLNRSSMNDSTRGSGPPCRPRQDQVGIAQAFDVVPDGGRFLEVEVRCRLAHFLLTSCDVRVELRLRPEMFRELADERRRRVIALVHAGDHVVDLLHD